jgi:hypothetical protein
VQLLVGLRNDLIHFKPRWHDHESPDRVEQKLTGKFDPNPLLGGTGNPWFPDTLA